MIPGFKAYFYPFMLCLLDGERRTINELRTYIASFFELSQDDLSEKTKGGNPRHNDRVSWTATYLKKLGLISLMQGKGYEITPSGKSLFELQGENFDLNTLRDLEGFHRLQKKEGSSNDHWVPGHWTSTGRYIAGYVSKWDYKGKQRRFTKDELDAYIEYKNKQRKRKTRNN